MNYKKKYLKYKKKYLNLKQTGSSDHIDSVRQQKKYTKTNY